MKPFHKVTALLACVAFAAPAFAQTVVTVGSLSGDLGSVIVVRGTETFSLQAGDQLFDGDRIITRQGGSVSLQAEGCTRDLTGLQSITVGADICVQQIASVDQSGLVQGEEIVGGGGVGAALPVIGGLAALGGAAAAAGGGDDGPSSP